MSLAAPPTALLIFAKVRAPKMRQTTKLSTASAATTFFQKLSAIPRIDKKHQRTQDEAETSATNRRTEQPLRIIQYRTRPSSRLTSSSNSPPGRVLTQRPTPLAGHESHRSANRQRERLVIRFACGRQLRRSACWRNRNKFSRRTKRLPV